ncbi:MAG: hypothetical protein ACFCBU_04010 [Cyanophyceae cyanobacterium]
MDPIQVAIVATAAQLVVKALEKGTELTVEEFWPGFLEKAKSIRMPKKFNGALEEMGERVQKQLPGETSDNPFNDPILLAELIEPEKQDEYNAIAIKAVEKELPPLPVTSQQIGNRIQKGNIANDNATIEFKGNVTQNFN